MYLPLMADHLNFLEPAKTDLSLDYACFLLFICVLS